MQSTSPYLEFSIDEWAAFRADTPLTLTEEEVHRLRSLNDPIALEEVERIYLSLSRLLASHVESSIGLFKQRAQFLNLHGQKTPFIIGIAGSVAVGKSTTARILKGTFVAMAGQPESRPHHHGRISSAQRKAARTRHHGPQGFSRKF